MNDQLQKLCMLKISNTKIPQTSRSTYSMFNDLQACLQFMLHLDKVLYYILH